MIKIKRMVAKSSHRTPADCCGKIIKKGEVFYYKRNVFSEPDDDGKPIVIAYSIKECCRCHYKKSEHNLRYWKFTTRCTHPQRFIEKDYGRDRGEFYFVGYYCSLCLSREVDKSGGDIDA